MARLMAQPRALGGLLELSAPSRLVVHMILPNGGTRCCKLSAHRAASFQAGLENAFYGFARDDTVNVTALNRDVATIDTLPVSGPTVMTFVVLPVESVVPLVAWS